MKLEFRKLRADEIDIRAATTSEKGASLLLYKDARCDMNILDETVGPMGWMRQHSRDNANCTVSIWDEDKVMWISKEDTGTESNTEAEKGLASDSFKRACFNWGIGRELYTAPFIWVGADTVGIEQNHKGKFEIKDKLHVSDIQYDGNLIVSLEIKTDLGAVVFSWTKNGGTKAPSPQPKKEPHTQPAVKSTPTEDMRNDDPDKTTITGKTAQETEFVCADCGQKFNGVTLPNGTGYTASDIAENTRKKYNRCLCWNCSMKAKGSAA